MKGFDEWLDNYGNPGLDTDMSGTDTENLVPVEFDVSDNGEFVIFRSEGTDPKTGVHQVREDWIEPAEAIDIAHKMHAKADVLLAAKRTREG